MRLFLFTVFLLSAFFSSGQFISREKALEDIDHLNQTLEAVHYNPYLFIPKEEYRRKTDSLKGSMGDSIRIHDFLQKLFLLTANLNDAHTSPDFFQPAFRPELVKKQFLPFSLISDVDNAVFFSPHKFDIPKGAMILSVNGVELTATSKHIQRFYGGVPHYARRLSHLFFPYFLFLSGVRPPFDVTYQHGGVQKQLRIDSALTYREALALSLPQLNAPPYGFEIRRNNIGYIDFRSMSGSWQDFSAFLDTSFRRMREKGVKNLVIDLRKNTGGNSMLGEVLLSYLTRKPFSLIGIKNWKVSDQYKSFLLANRDSGATYHKMKSGEIWKIGSCEPKQGRFIADTLFEGKVYFLTGHLTFSSANMLADAVKQYKLGTIVGEPTGENTNDFGEVYQFTLPNSKLRINATTSFDVGTNCRMDVYSPVMPDVLISPTLKQVLEGEDPVMDYIIRMTTERTKK